MEKPQYFLLFNFNFLKRIDCIFDCNQHEIGNVHCWFFIRRINICERNINLCVFQDGDETETVESQKMAQINAELAEQKKLVAQLQQQQAAAGAASAKAASENGKS